MEQQFCPKADFLFGTENGKGHWKNTLEKTKYLLGGSPLKDPGGKHAGRWWQLCKSSCHLHASHRSSGFLGLKQYDVVFLTLCQACSLSCKVLLSLFPRSLGKISSVGLWWVPFFYHLKINFCPLFHCTGWATLTRLLMIWVLLKKWLKGMRPRQPFVRSWSVLCCNFYYFQFLSFFSLQLNCFISAGAHLQVIW